MSPGTRSSLGALIPFLLGLVTLSEVLWAESWYQDGWTNVTLFSMPSLGRVWEPQYAPTVVFYLLWK